MNYLTRTLSLATLVILFSASWLQAQEEQKSRNNSINLEISQGIVFYTENNTNSNITRVDVNLTFCERWPNLCPIAGISLLLNGGAEDPHPTPPIILWPQPFPFPDPSPWNRFDICQLKLGSSTLGLVNIGLQGSLGGNFDLSVIAGVGFTSYERKTSDIEGTNFTATTISAPVSNIEGTLSFQATDRFSINANVGLLNTYFGNLTILAEDGSSIVVEGYTANSPTVSLGVGLRI